MACSLVKIQAWPMSFKKFVYLLNEGELQHTLIIPIAILYLSGEYEHTDREGDFASLLEIHSC